MSINDHVKIVAAMKMSEPNLSNDSFNYPAHSRRRTFKCIFNKGVLALASNIWKQFPPVLTAGGRWRAQTAHRTGEVSY